MGSDCIGSWSLLIFLLCAVAEARKRLEISDIEIRDITLSRQRTTKTLFRLCGCAGWSAPLVFTYGINRFSHDLAQVESLQSCGSTSSHIGMWDLDSIPMSCQILHHFHTNCLRKLLKIRWQATIPDTKVLKREGMQRLHTPLTLARPRWTGHVTRMPDECLPKKSSMWSGKVLPKWPNEKL